MPTAVMAQWSTVPLTGTMAPQETTPVAMHHAGQRLMPLAYGWLLAGPVTWEDTKEGVQVLAVEDNPDDEYADGTEWALAFAEVSETSGCECGNPWVLCHPEA